MKIGLITGEYPPMQGGVGDFTRELAEALATLGHEPHVITNYELRITNYELRVTSYELRMVHCVVRQWDWRCWAAIRAVTRQVGLEVLNVQYQAAAYRMHPAINFLPVARRRLGLPPIVTTFHDLNAPYLFPKAGPLRQWVVRELARRSQAVIVTNYEDERRILDFGFRKSEVGSRKSEVGSRKSEVRDPIPNTQSPLLARIPIGSNIKPQLPAGYQRDEWRAQWGIKPDDILIGYFGFLHPLKGGEILVRALARLVSAGLPARVLFIGGKAGSSDAATNMAYAARVEALARELGVSERLTFTGFVPDAQVTAAFYASDMTALPYLEGASLRHGTLMAALAHGRAIVTTRSRTPAPELRDGENVLLIPPGDDAALAAALQRLIESPTLRAHLERGAAELAKLFTWDIIAARTLEVYQQVTQTCKGGLSTPPAPG